MLRGRAREYLKGTRHHGAVRLPMEKFLFSRVGRNWNEIHSELSREFDRRTYVGYRFWRSFGRDYGKDVATNCWIGAETGNIYDADAINRWKSNQTVEGFYVHPLTGILCHREEPLSQKNPYKQVDRIRIDLYNGFEKIEGIWYRTTYKHDPYYVAYPWIRPNQYKGFILHTKRQLNSKELRAMNITNDHPEKWQNKVCEVCLYMDGIKILQRCYFCDICDAWICERDKYDWFRRSETAVKKLIEKKLKEQQETGV